MCRSHFPVHLEYPQSSPESSHLQARHLSVHGSVRRHRHLQIYSHIQIPTYILKLIHRCSYIYIDTYILILIHTDSYIYIYTYILIRIHIYSYIYTHTYPYLFVHIYPYIFIDVRTYVLIYSHRCSYIVPTHMYRDSHVHKKIHSLSLQVAGTLASVSQKRDAVFFFSSSDR